MWQCPNCHRRFLNENQSHFCRPIDTIDEYIAEQPEEVRPLLQSVRQTIRAAAPDATERISWQMPTFWQGENLIHFAAFQRHISLYPGSEAVAAFAHRLKGYKTSKGCIQFPFDKPIDHELIADIVRFRLEQAAKGESIFQKPAPRERCPMPDFVADALTKANLWERYNVRPPYQQNDYLRWITQAKREETRQKRLAQMLAELEAGDAYMGMPYRAKTE